MSNVVNKKDETYDVIIKTAKRLFIAEGKINTTSQEIADNTCVNRTLINYYLRTSKSLIDLVFKEAKEEEEKQQEFIIMSSLPVREKFEKYLDFYFQNAKQYPYMEMYIVTHMNQYELHEFQSKEPAKMLPKIFEEIQQEMYRGSIQQMEPMQFLLNFISLVSFPISMRPLLQHGLQISDEDFEKLLDDRKEVILKTIFKN